MNYDLIIKLAKLANNNPNENEANAAARKVCKLLAEGKFQFNNSTPNSTPSNTNTTWNDVRRSSEPFWKSNPPPNASSDFYEMWERLRKMRERDRTTEKRSYTYWDQVNNNPFVDPIEKVRCTKCGFESERLKSTIKHPFICLICSQVK